MVGCAGEVGSGPTEAAMGRFFSKSVPLGGNHVAMGQELPALHELADMDAVELVARGGPDALDGGARLDYDELIFAAARKALAADPACVVVLHTVAGSKTGLRLPSPVVADTLKREFGNRIVSVLDACQMRHHPELIPRWLDEQGTAGRGFQNPDTRLIPRMECSYGKRLTTATSAPPSTRLFAHCTKIAHHKTRSD